MRVIKFRAWQTNVGDYDKITKKFTPKPHYFYGENVIVNGNGQLLSVECGWDIQGVEESTDYVLEQYTGMKDKNGREIYEGDILIREAEVVENGYIFDKYAVEFYNGRFCGIPIDMSPLLGPEYFKDCEIIGSIHEDRELSKEKK